MEDCFSLKNNKKLINLNKFFHTYSKSFTQKNNFPVINSLSINTASEINSYKKKNKSPLKRNLSSEYRDENYLLSIIYNILEKDRKKEKYGKNPEKIAITLFDNQQNNKSIKSCLIRSHQKIKNKKSYNCSNDFKRNNNNKNKIISPKSGNKKDEDKSKKRPVNKNDLRKKSNTKLKKNNNLINLNNIKKNKNTLNQLKNPKNNINLMDCNLNENNKKYIKIEMNRSREEQIKDNEEGKT